MEANSLSLIFDLRYANFRKISSSKVGFGHVKTCASYTRSIKLKYTDISIIVPSVQYVISWKSPVPKNAYAGK